MKKIAFIVFALTALSASPLSAKFDPSFVWTTIETPHFLIHYHQGGEELARKTASIAEDVHSRLVPRIKWAPKQKTHLVLVDAMDEANGMSTPIPYNLIILFPTQPVGEPGFSTTAYDEWLRMLITHEYTHTLQLDMVRGIPAALQNIFGRIYFPNLFQPMWMIEGLATYEETEQNSGGRGRSPGADMILRMAALEGPFPTLGQASVFIDSWPSGDVPYLFGESFTRYIAGQYGREKLADISVVYSGRGVPFLVTSTGERVLNKEYSELWDEWKVSLEKHYQKQLFDIQAKGLTKSTALTTRGFFNGYPAFSPDGRRIAYSVHNADEFPGLYVINSDGSGDVKLIENVFPTSAAGAGALWSPDGSRLYYTRLEIKGVNIYNDIYYHDFSREREVRLTKGLRARDPHASHDGKYIVFVANRMGRTRLARLDLTKERKRPAGQKDVTFLNEESIYQYAGPRFSPDGSRIAVSVWQPGGNRDIWILDASGGMLASISADRAMDGTPEWSADGKYVYFSSDRTGIFNIYAYEMNSGRLFQVTNVLGGAFTPAVSPDGKKIIFTSYSSRGYDIHSMENDVSLWRPADAYQNPYPKIQYEEKEIKVASRPYSAIPTLLPRFWLPWFGYSHESGVLVGGLTYAQDAAQRHQYYLTGLYGPKNGRTWYSIDYAYDGLLPTLYFYASDTDNTHSDFFIEGERGEDYTERDKTYGASVITPLLRFRSQHYLSAGYQWREISRLSSLPPWTGYAGILPAEGVLASGRASYLFNNARQYGFSISPEQGRTIELGYERMDASLGGDYELDKYTADWHEYINFPWTHHVLLARAFAGASTGEVIPQRAFQLGGDNPGDATISIGEQSVYLRGYPGNAFRGRKIALGSLEYRFPVKNLEIGPNTKPVFLRRIHGAVFFEAGNAWDRTFYGSELKRSAGIEARLDTYFSYFLPITFRLVAVRGFDEDGEGLVYFDLWMPLSLF